MNVAAILDIAKKNILIIVCLLVMILAMVAAFVWPLPGKFAEVQAKADARKAEYEALEGLATKERKWPQTDLFATEQRKLDGFPTEAVITQGNALVADITTQAKATIDLAAKLNEKQLLVKDSLPNAPTSLAYRYQTEYQKLMDFSNPDTRAQTLAIKVLKAGVIPTEADIAAEKSRRAAEIQANELIPGQNDAIIQAKIAQMEATIGDTLRQEMATKSQLYMNADALDVYPGVIGTTEPPKAEPIYYSQLGLWVQDDVCKAIAAVNAAANAEATAQNPRAGGIVASAVKHLIKLDVNEDLGRTSGGGQTQPQPTDGSAPPAGAANMTARVSNATYEVIPFRLTMYVDAAKVPAVLTELSRNKFITVLEVDLQSVDMGSQLLAGFFYGTRPVVQLNLECEALFLKSWLTKYMPPSIAAPAPPPS